MVHLKVFDPKFRQIKSRYLLQSLLAALVLFVILSVLEIGANLIVIAAVGSSTFVIFTMPESRTAYPRSLVGGHLIGLVSGAITYSLFLGLSSLPQDLISEGFLIIISGALSVGLATFLMSVTNTEHPPAGGTALAIVLQGLTWTSALFVIASAIGLSLTRWLLRKWLRNLS